MSVWYDAFGRWAKTCESVDRYNVGAEQKRHRQSIKGSWTNLVDSRISSS